MVFLYTLELIVIIITIIVYFHRHLSRIYYTQMYIVTSNLSKAHITRDNVQWNKNAFWKATQIWIRRRSLKTRKKHQKPRFKFQGHLRSSIILFFGSPSSVLVLKERLYLTSPHGELVKPRRSKYKLVKSTFYAENFIRRLFLSVFSHFGAIQSLNVRESLKSQKILKTYILEVQSRSRSSKHSGIWSWVLVTINKKSLFNCNHFHASRVNSSKIAIFA